MHDPLPSFRFRCAPILALALLLAGSAPAAAQCVVRADEDLDFDRPEAWAMAWFAALTSPTALGSPEPLAPWSVELSLEGGWVPTLSDEQRTVGFLGSKPEDLNRTSVIGRPRLAVGLPGKLTATLAWMPPTQIDGVEPNLLALSLARPLWEGERARIGARLFGQTGSFEGDFTCPRDAAEAGLDPDRNPYNCQEPSEDEMSLQLFGLELQAGTALARWPQVSPYAALSYSRLDAEFQVRARYNTLIDRSLLETDGDFWTGTLGLAVDAGERWRLAGEVVYTPLDVTDRAGHQGRESDGPLNVRALLAYRLR